MTAPHTPPSLIHAALIVTDNEGHARIDREFLKRAHIKTARHVISGIEAIEVLRDGRFDLVICDTTLADMDGHTFVAALQADATLATIPVILTMVDGRRADILNAVKLGVAGLCLRPYSQDTFDRHLLMATHMARFAASEKAALVRAAAREAAGDADRAASAYTAVADTPDNAPQYFEEGMLALSGRKYEQALMAFHKAVAANALYVEAYLGLARVWLAKGSPRRYRHFMKEAAAACARTSRFLELRDQFVEALKGDDVGFNPFLALGNELFRERRYNAAVAVFRHALELAPKSADAYLGLSKAYHFLRQPDLAKQAIGKSLALNNRNQEAQHIHQCLTTRQVQEEDVELLEEHLETVAETGDTVEYPLLLRGMLYLAGMATNTLVRPRRQARAA